MKERPVPDQERVFNTFRSKIYRPFYSIREFRAGLVILVLLAVVAGWVAWRGAHPDPALFLTQDKLLSSKGGDIHVYKQPLQRLDEPAAPASTTGTMSAGNPLEPFPAEIVSDNWRATGPVQVFDETNLYIKIDGRESFYKTFGFKKLYYLSLQSSATNGLTIDIELFDLGSSENSLGAFSAELSNPAAGVKMGSGNLSYVTSNGGFLAQERYYARILGSDDNQTIRDKIQSIRDLMMSRFPEGKLPWTFALFVGEVGAAPGGIRYQKENAFSFGFASDVYSAVVPGSKETEVFIVKKASTGDATALAKQFAEGFAGYGSKLKTPPGHPAAALVNNEFINTVEGVEPFQNYVLGIRFAKSAEDAVRWMDKLKSGLQKLPPA
jgi:uncharacterized protein DUF6599